VHNGVSGFLYEVRVARDPRIAIRAWSLFWDACPLVDHERLMGRCPGAATRMAAGLAGTSFRVVAAPR
jgi:hypothetical protein